MSAGPSLRKATRRHRKSYYEPDSDSDSDFGAPVPRRSLPLRASRHLREAYKEDTSSNSTSADEDNVPPPLPARLRKPRSIAPPRNTAFKNFKRRKTTHHTPPRDALIEKDKWIPGITTLVSSKPGQIPSWQKLEYQILLQIMQYAAYPLYTGTSRDTGAIRWLLDTSRLCSSFHDACIGALMCNPPLYPAHRAHWLMDLLKASARDYAAEKPSPQSAGEYGGVVADPSAAPNQGRRISLDYRKKIKSLDIEVKQILIKKGGLDLIDLLRHTPLVHELRLYHNHDSLADKYIWAMPGSSRSQDRWSYDSVFEALERNSLQLRHFEWNGRFLKDDPSLSTFASKQLQGHCLSKLRSITIRNFILPRAEKLVDHVTGTEVSDTEKMDNADAKQLASWRSTVINAFTSLSDLIELSIHTCNIFDDAIIASLTAGLTRLTICSTPFIKSEGLQKYLHDSGATLTHLTLRSNQSLSLGFMSTLKATSPHLRELEVDLTYHDPTSFHDTEPLFDELLPDGPPTWPSNLESINIGPLRNLSTQDAELFFQSLVDAASSLPYLRTLSLRTLLKKASWRDRAQMRGKWNAKLHQTFHVKNNPEVTAPSRPREENKDKGRKSRRINGNTQVNDTEAQGHGRCHTIIFELSDQRPAQEQFCEADFLDSEPEGDEEWNGKDDAVETPRYSSRRYAW